MADFVKFIGGNANNHMRGNHVQNFGSQLASNPHFFNFVSSFNYDAHQSIFSWSEKFRGEDWLGFVPYLKTCSLSDLSLL
jgi:hypothetical protein